MSDSSIVIIQGTVGLYTVATRCHTCFVVTLKYTEDSSLTKLRHSLPQVCTKEVCLKKSVGMPEQYQTNEKCRVQLSFCVVVVKGGVSTWGSVTKRKKCKKA